MMMINEYSCKIINLSNQMEKKSSHSISGIPKKKIYKIMNFMTFFQNFSSEKKFSNKSGGGGSSSSSSYLNLCYIFVLVVVVVRF